MKTYYVVLPLALLLFSCNESKKTDSVEKKVLTEKKARKKTPVLIMNEQYNDIEYQIGAFNLGIERLHNKELKDYLLEKRTDLETLLSDFQETASVNNTGFDNSSDINKKELYKLSIADDKDFDKIFVMYYKDFLNKSIDKLSAVQPDNKDFDHLKNKYGNILYEQKLYFDVVK